MAETISQFNWPPIGQDKAAVFLEKSLLANKLAQTYIFSGPSDLGKSSLALAFARNLWRYDKGQLEAGDNFDSLNSDLYILSKEPDKKQIGVEQAREFNQRLGLSSFLNSYKIGIIKDAESLSPEAQNALLKTLEEPRDKVIIILLTTGVEFLLPTIVSRSQVLYFYPVATDTVYDYLLASVADIKRSAAKELAAAALGRPLQAKRWAENQESHQLHFQLVQQLFDFLAADLGQRLALINQASSASGLAAETALLWLDVWESLWRDALLFSLGQTDRLRYPALSVAWQTQLNPDVNLETTRHALNCLKQLQQARLFIRAFVNPKNVLESLAIYF